MAPPISSPMSPVWEAIFNAPSLGLANTFSKEPDSKHFMLYKPRAMRVPLNASVSMRALYRCSAKAVVDNRQTGVAVQQ